MTTGRTFKVLLAWDTEEKLWVTQVPALGDLSTYGRTRQEALDMTREAIAGFLEASAKQGLPIPDVPDPELVDLEVAV
ncbi:MAG: type II toxin-antitoxin system HicB family antitoxin [Nitrospira sp.]|nr:type II toxin-antitoxin system HicB family antitoxin [Nitrospira sp.]